jgi:hypothetical protein
MSSMLQWHASRKSDSSSSTRLRSFINGLLRQIVDGGLRLLAQQLLEFADLALQLFDEA